MWSPCHGHQAERRTVPQQSQARSSRTQQMSSTSPALAPGSPHCTGVPTSPMGAQRDKCRSGPSHGRGAWVDTTGIRALFQGGPAASPGGSLSCTGHTGAGLCQGRELTGPCPTPEAFLLSRAPTGCPSLAAGIRYLAGKSPGQAGRSGGTWGALRVGAFGSLHSD